MRLALGLLVGLIAGATWPAGVARADPYRWCADYGGRGGGSSNCYFLTLQQCQWALSGRGGICRVNGFYDGRPVVTPEERPVHRRSRRHARH